MKLPFSIAYRFLKSGKMQTWVIILGIAVGVSVQVFIGSLISGLQKSLVDKTIGSSSQITVTLEPNYYFDNYNDHIQTLKDGVDGLESLTPTLSVNGTLIEDTNTTPVLLRGFDFSSANSIYGFDSKIIDGDIPDQLNEIAIGKGIQESLGLSIGDVLTYSVPTIGDVQVTITGVFDFKVSAINDAWGITILPTVQTILAIGDQVSTIEMQIEEDRIFEAVELAASVQTISALFSNQEETVSNWIDNNGELLSGLQGQSISSIMIQVFVMVSVVLAIASVLAIIVMQKSKQIGILKAMGIQNRDASLVFLFEGLILGTLGALMGVLLGLGLSIAFTTFAINADTGEPVVPLFIDPGFIALSAGIAIIAALGASLISARKSSKLSVIEVIRNA